MTPSQARSPSAPEAIEDQLPSGGSLRPLSLVGDTCWLRSFGSFAVYDVPM